VESNLIVEGPPESPTLVALKPPPITPMALHHTRPRAENIITHLTILKNLEQASSLEITSRISVNEQ